MATRMLQGSDPSCHRQRRRVGTTLSLCLLAYFGCSRTSESEGLKCKVIAIVDGDTIKVLDRNNKQSEVRLRGIDAPEGRQAFGNVSRQHLSDLVFGKYVVLQGEKTDRRGRMLCKVLVDGRDANLEQLNAGLAWFYKQYEKELSIEDRQSYSVAEDQARNAKIGLWSDPTPTPPWDYRHRADVVPPEKTGVNRPPSTNGPIIAHRHSRKYHWPGCPYYDAIAPQNREYFKSREEAEKAGYRPAQNCDQ